MTTLSLYSLPLCKRTKNDHLCAKRAESSLSVLLRETARIALYCHFVTFAQEGAVQGARRRCSGRAREARNDENDHE